ncbi:hypothetical protein D917_05336 [Trichinella nativa]|uniref:Uncharacterized protein n=1 Tax=Trichinella nativa TaxID=6335 RepID=A0A1Y3EWD4_9BILA|nr:hypothetical protein D917_05336 [Trichinella nativa]
MNFLKFNKHRASLNLDVWEQHIFQHCSVSNHIDRPLANENQSNRTNYKAIVHFQVRRHTSWLGFNFAGPIPAGPQLQFPFYSKQANQ